MGALEIVKRNVQLSILQLKGKRVNRLVAMAFILNPLNKPIVDHMDRLRTNNFVGNLRWATISENNVNQYSINKSSGKRGIHYTSELGLYFVSLPCDKIGSRYIKSFVSLDDAIIDRVEQMLLRYKDFVCHDEIYDYCQAVIRKGVNAMLLY